MGFLYRTGGRSFSREYCELNLRIIWGIITLKTTEAAMCEIYRMETQLKSIKSNPQFRRLYFKLQKRELIQKITWTDLIKC